MRGNIFNGNCGIQLDSVEMLIQIDAMISPAWRKFGLIAKSCQEQDQQTRHVVENDVLVGSDTDVASCKSPSKDASWNRPNLQLSMISKAKQNRP